MNRPKASEIRIRFTDGDGDDKNRKSFTVEATVEVMNALVRVQWSIQPDKLAQIFDPAGQPKKRDIDYWAQKFSVESKRNIMTFWSSLSAPYDEMFLRWINENYL